MYSHHVLVISNLAQRGWCGSHPLPNRITAYIVKLSQGVAPADTKHCHNVLASYSPISPNEYFRPSTVRLSWSAAVILFYNYPADTRRSINVDLTLVQRRRPCTNVTPALIQRLLSTGYLPINRTYCFDFIC